MTITELEQEIDKIKLRNRRVELEKAWETSWTRRIALSLCTYMVVVLFFLFGELEDPFIDSIPPAVGFVISTLSLPYLKKFWFKYRGKVKVVLKPVE